MQLISPRSSVESSLIFLKRIALMKALSRRFGAAKVPIVLEQQPAETALQIEQRLDGQARRREVGRSSVSGGPDVTVAGEGQLLTGQREDRAGRDYATSAHLS